MSWRSWWPPALEASDLLGTGRLSFAPDYESCSAPFQEVIVSDPREFHVQFIAQMARRLRPGQTLNIKVNDNYTPNGRDPYFIVEVVDCVDGDPE